MGLSTATALAGGANIIGGLIGGEQSRQARSSSERAYQDALAQLTGIPIPSIEEQELAYELPELVGTYAPILEATPEELGPTAMEDIAVDPRLRQAQMQALETMATLGETGMTDEEAAVLDQIKRNAAAQAQARQQAILQNMAERGMGGSGSELAARMMASQQAADLASQQGMETAAMAQQRALDSIARAGQLGGNIRGQEFGEASDVARAKDVINQFNVLARQQQQQRNIAEQRAAQQQNLQERQRIAEQRTQLRNLQQERNKALIQQQFENRLGRAAPAAQMGGQYAQQQYRSAADVGAGAAGIGRAIGDILVPMGKKPNTKVENESK